MPRMSPVNAAPRRHRWPTTLAVLLLLLGLAACGQAHAGTSKPGTPETTESPRARSGNQLFATNATWTQAPSLPSGLLDEQSLHCATSTLCLTTIQKGETWQTMALTRSGWAPTSSRGTPTDLRPGNMTCPTAGSCVSLRDGVYRYSGGQWNEVAPLALPYGADAVSCFAATKCVVGYSTGGSNTNPWWAAAAISAGKAANPEGMTPPPAGATINELSCSAANDCIGLGSGQSGDYSGTWDGTKWTFTSIPDGATADSHPVQQCASPTFCISATDGNLAWWDGKTWHSKTDASDLNHVDAGDCLPSGACVIVNSDALVFVSSGGSLTEGPKPPEYPFNVQMSCSGAQQSCVVVFDNEKTWVVSAGR